jgi:hypothetical protein
MLKEQFTVFERNISHPEYDIFKGGLISGLIK